MNHVEEIGEKTEKKQNRLSKKKKKEEFTNLKNNYFSWSVRVFFFFFCYTGKHVKCGTNPFRYNSNKNIRFK